MKLLHDAPATVEGDGVSPELGYRGFVVKLDSDAGGHVARVHDGLIEIDGKYFRDADRMMEKFLVRTMPKELAEQFGAILPK